MTFREYIKLVGYDTFHKIANGWYNENWVMDNGLDKKVDRYALWGYRPFYILNQAYNKAFENDEEVGSTYDWLCDYPTKEEVDEWKKSNECF